jgi:hypothetical protein
MSNNIVKGYKGVIDLDLSLVPDLYKKTAIDQHNNDIAEYKKYQASLKKEHRYENTILRINKQLNYENMMKEERLKKERGY